MHFVSESKLGHGITFKEHWGMYVSMEIHSQESWQLFLFQFIHTKTTHN